MVEWLWSLVTPASLRSFILTLLDVAIVSYVIYRGMLLVRGTRAVQLLKGLAVLAAVSLVSNRLDLVTVNWILDQVRLFIIVALPVVFQPELRRALERLGRGKIFSRTITFWGTEEASKMIDELCRAVQILVKNRYGAIIVIERDTGLVDYTETGVQVDGLMSAEFLVNIFFPHTPLHDGAVVLRGDRILAAGCFLPLTDSPYLSKQLGTRHRAALGISEMSDAVAVVVSEETGTVSVAEEGKLTRYLDERNLRDLLEKLLVSSSLSSSPWWHWRS